MRTGKCARGIDAEDLRSNSEIPLLGTATLLPSVSLYKVREMIRCAHRKLMCEAYES